MKNFWLTLPQPFFCMAPMADVTDPAFRVMIAKYGKKNVSAGWRGGPDVMWTEFVSADGLFKGGYDALIGDLNFNDSERPIVAQFFSQDPELMSRAAELAVSLGFDGIDINMGCPQDNVCKQGAGAAIIKDPQRAQEIIRATKEYAGNIPVSVKTRIGYTTNEIETWIPALLETQPAVITIHGRTKKEMSKVPAHWDVIACAVAIRNEIQKDIPDDERTLMIGNGDVADLLDARMKAHVSGCEGIMLGRAIYGNPWLFADISRPPIQERLNALREHIETFDKLIGQRKPFVLMKKHFKAYLKGGEPTKELLLDLMDATNAQDAIETIKRFLSK